jgi:hypothetical protein
MLKDRSLTRVILGLLVVMLAVSFLLAVIGFAAPSPVRAEELGCTPAHFDRDFCGSCGGFEKLIVTKYCHDPDIGWWKVGSWCHYC